MHPQPAPTPCVCRAYPFPHRAASGKRVAPGAEPSSCEACQFSSVVSDPYGTGDYLFTQTNCMAPAPCPWGRV